MDVVDIIFKKVEPILETTKATVFQGMLSEGGKGREGKEEGRGRQVMDRKVTVRKVTVFQGMVSEGGKGKEGRGGREGEGRRWIGR
jgi:hypothetical protein